MSLRRKKLKHQFIKSVMPTKYLDDGKIHRFKNKQRAINVINWNGTVKQLQEFMQTPIDGLDNCYLYDQKNTLHFTQHDFGAEEFDDDYVYQSGIVCDFNFVIPKNTLIIKYYPYHIHHQNFYLPKYQIISEHHFKNHFPHQIRRCKA